jgi:hypothetical protein
VDTSGCPTGTPRYDLYRNVGRNEEVDGGLFERYIRVLIASLFSAQGSAWIEMQTTKLVAELAATLKSADKSAPPPQSQN